MKKIIDLSLMYHKMILIGDFEFRLDDLIPEHRLYIDDHIFAIQLRPWLLHSLLPYQVHLLYSVTNISLTLINFGPLMDHKRYI